MTPEELEARVEHFDEITEILLEPILEEEDREAARLRAETHPEK